MTGGGGSIAGVLKIAPGRLQKVSQSTRKSIRHLQDDNLMVEKDFSHPRTTKKQTRQQLNNPSTHVGIERDIDVIIGRNLERQRSAYIPRRVVEPTLTLNDIDVAHSENGTPVAQEDDVSNHSESEGCIPSKGECQIPKRKKLTQVASRIPLALQVNEATDPPCKELAQNEFEEMHQEDTNVEDVMNLSPNVPTNTEATCKVRGRGQRGKYKSYVIDSKIKGKRSKLTIEILDEIDRAIGHNARHLVNECGRVVRTKAPLNVQNWEDAFSIAGESMWKEIQEKFQMVESDRHLKMYSFVVDTMRRLYRLWRSRLHSYYKSPKCGKTDEERVKNPPDDLPLAQWESCVKYFSSSEFKAVSERNSKNRLSDKRCKHTTGNLSFAEVEDILTKENKNVKPIADVIWLVEHTHKNDEGRLEWADDNRSKDIHEKLKNVVATAGDTMTQEEILIQVLEPRSGYIRGKGSALRSYTKGKHQMEQKNL